MSINGFGGRMRRVSGKNQKAANAMGDRGNRRRGRVTLLALAAAASVTGIIRVASAANYTWNSSPSSSNWNTLNWSTTGSLAAKPSAGGGDSLFFVTSSLAALNNDYAVDTIFN